MPKTPQAIEQHLRSASDAILLLTGEVEQLERHKRGVQPEDARFEVLAKAVRDAAIALADFARGEEEWARHADGARADVLPIAEAETAPKLGAILNRWRAIERQLNDAPPGSPEAVALFDEFQRVRAEYMTAFEAHSRSDGEEG